MRLKRIEILTKVTMVNGVLRVIGHPKSKVLTSAKKTKIEALYKRMEAKLTPHQAYKDLLQTIGEEFGIFKIAEITEKRMNKMKSTENTPTTH